MTAMASIAEWTVEPSEPPAAPGPAVCLRGGGWTNALGTTGFAFASAVTAASLAEADCAWVPGGVFAAGPDFEVPARAVLVFCEPLPAVDPATGADRAWVPGGIFAAGSDFEVPARVVVVFCEPLPAVDPATGADCAWVPGGVFAAGPDFEAPARVVVVFSGPLPVVDWVVGADFLAVI